MRRLLILLVLVLPAACPAPAGAIVGGGPATQPYPFMAQLEVKNDEGEFEFTCGASLVRPAWVLTAAHCVSGKKPDAVRVLLGRPRLSSSGGEDPGVAEVLVNEAFMVDGATHDVALLRLARDAAAAPVRLVGLSERATWAPGVRATVIGWGSTFYGGPVSDELREVQVPIRSDAECASTVGTTIGYDNETQLCAGEPIGGGDSCSGDSGGPLLSSDAGGALVQVGVVSAGLGCAYPTQYGVYARIGDRALHDWIAARLPAPGTPAPEPPAQGGGGAPAAAPAPAPRISLPTRLRPARGQRSLRLRIRTTAPLTRVVATVRRGRTVLARGTRASIRTRATLALRARRTLRAGRVTVTVTARDATGRPVRRTTRARLSR